MKSFNELKLPTALEKALQGMSLPTVTAIQAQAIPVAMSNRDLIACVQPGSGRTLAFCIPLITRILKAPNKGSLILVPTAELAEQVMEVLKQLTVHAPEIKIAALVDNAPIASQSKALTVRPRVLVATPARLVEHLKKGGVSLSSMEILVLNEADRILEMGFQPQLAEILRFLPRSRQTLLFSATMPPEIVKMTEKWLREPVRVTIATEPKPLAPAARAVATPSTPITKSDSGKNDLLLSQLNAKKGSVLVFTRTKSRTDILAKYLAKYGHPVARVQAIKGFRSGECRILVATDVEARALDVSNIKHVINYDLLLKQ